MRSASLWCVLLLGLAACGDDTQAAGSGGGGSGGGGAGSATGTAPSSTDASSAASGTPSSSIGASTDESAASTGEGGSSVVASSSADGSGGATTGTSGTAASSGPSSGSGGGAQGCLQDLTAGHHEVSCEGGIAYDVEIPDACPGGGCGLVVDIHGYTMTGDSEDENTGMRALGQAHGYVVVQPTAPTDALGLPSWDQATHAPLVHRFVADVADALVVDRTRVHAMGFSQGGGMTFRLLCDHADLFASGAPIGALAGCPFEGAESPSEEVDIMQVHGRKDAVVSFDAIAIPQRDDALAAWPFGAPEVFEEDDMHRATRWTTSGGTTFELWEHDYTTSAEVAFFAIEGHCVPGGEDFDGIPAGYSCEDEGTFVFGDLAMAFFEAHPK